MTNKVSTMEFNMNCFVKTEADEYCCDDQSDMDCIEISEVPFLQEFIEKTDGECEFYVGEEEVDLSQGNENIKKFLPLEIFDIETSDDEYEPSNIQIKNDPDSSSTTQMSLSPIFQDQHQANETKRSRSKEEKYKCSYCSRKFCNKSYLQYHERSHTGEKPFACDKCPVRFSLNSSLIRHKRSHSGDKPYQCSICFKRFVSSGNLKDHQSVHTDERRFCCDKCPKRFKRKRLLHTHYKIHEENKSPEILHNCDECSMEFTTIASLNKHKYNHLGVKRYRCAICSIDFSIRHLYIEHMDMHTMIYKCQYCRSQFQQEHEFIAHCEAHLNGTTEKFQCEFCMKSYSCRATLRRHQQIHNNNQLFHCQLCPKTFRLRSYLSTHMKMHNGSKVYNCVQCSKTFKQRARLELHKRSHLNEVVLNIKPEIISLSDAE